jgi:signal peptidase I
MSTASGFLITEGNRGRSVKRRRHGVPLPLNRRRTTSWVVGLPGDRIEYFNKRLTVNGRGANEKLDNTTIRLAVLAQFDEVLGEPVTALSLTAEPLTGRGFNTHPGPVIQRSGLVQYSGKHFMMGDNTITAKIAASGFVPDQNIVGRAFLIWMNFGNIGRIGNFH